MELPAIGKPGPTSGPELTPAVPVTATNGMLQSVQSRMIAGLLFALPILITFYVIFWIFSNLQQYFIDPLAALILLKIQWTQPDHPIPEWFVFYVAPVIAIVVILLFLYTLGFIVNTRVRGAIEWLMLKVPVVSFIYDSFRSIFLTFEKPAVDKGPTKMVLVSFPHQGMKVPAFVTATCKDIATNRTLVCVYVPTTPVPTSGFFLLVPEEEITELNWTMEETLQAVMSGGLTTPHEVRYFKSAL